MFEMCMVLCNLIRWDIVYKILFSWWALYCVELLLFTLFLFIYLFHAPLDPLQGYKNHYDVDMVNIVMDVCL
jgi:hypothetical protein